VIKSNLASFPEPLEMWVTEGGEVRFGAAPAPPQRASALEQAMQATCEMLQGGPLPAEQVMHDLQALGFAERTIRRAKVQLGVCSNRDREGWVWALPLDKLVLAGRGD
jgi:hypothetical protein